VTLRGAARLSISGVLCADAQSPVQERLCTFYVDHSLAVAAVESGEHGVEIDVEVDRAGSLLSLTEARKTS